MHQTIFVELRVGIFASAVCFLIVGTVVECFHSFIHSCAPFLDWVFTDEKTAFKGFNLRSTFNKIISQNKCALRFG